MAGKVIKSMTTYQRYVETAAKKAEEALGEVPRGPGQRSSPRLIQRLEEAEKKLKDQYNRIYEAYTLATVEVDMKSEEEVLASRGFWGEEDIREFQICEFQIHEKVVGEIVCRRITSTTVYDDSDPIPVIKDVKIEPVNKKMNAKPTLRETFPDSGCQETLVSADLMDYLGLDLDKERKNVSRELTARPMFHVWVQQNFN